MRRQSTARLLRRRRLTGWGLLAALVTLGISSLLDRGGAFRYRGNDWDHFDRKVCHVTAVIDGDTIRIKPPAGGHDVTVRMLGIDAAELHDEDGNPAYWSQEAAAYLYSVLRDQDVLVRVEPTRTRDRYGRLLAYIYLGEADSVNLALIRDGQVYADPRFRHTFDTQFALAESQARAKGLGLWRAVKPNQMPRYLQERMWKRRENDASH